MSDEDEAVRAAMRALREHDERAAPPFARAHDAARRAATRRRRRRVAAWTGSIALAAVVLLAILLGRPTELAPAPPREELAFLLEPPSASVIEGTGTLERSW